MKGRVFSLLTAALMLWPTFVWCGEGEQASALAHQAPDPGPGANWFIRLIVDSYNNRMLLYAIIGLAIMTIMGLVLGFATDRFLEFLGFETKKLEHLE